jgi:hypothetical protein
MAQAPHEAGGPPTPKARSAGGPGAKRPGWGLGARPPKDTLLGQLRRRASAEQPGPNQKGRLAVRSLGVASPRGADAGPRGEVSGESFSQKGLIVYSVSG